MPGRGSIPPSPGPECPLWPRPSPPPKVGALFISISRRPVRRRPLPRPLPPASFPSQTYGFGPQETPSMPPKFGPPCQEPKSSGADRMTTGRPIQTTGPPCEPSASTGFLGARMRQTQISARPPNAKDLSPKFSPSLIPTPYARRPPPASTSSKPTSRKRWRCCSRRSWTRRAAHCLPTATR